jgi:hypothetical protein
MQYPDSIGSKIAFYTEGGLFILNAILLVWTCHAGVKELLKRF